jgi:DNA-binding CsgD family transcriptional regulator
VALVETPFYTPETNLCLASLDRRLKVTGVNREFTRFVGGESENVYGRELPCLLDPGCRERVRDRLAELIAGQSKRVSEKIAAAGVGFGAPTGDLTGISVVGAGGLTIAVVIVVSVSPQDAPERDAERPALCPVDARIVEGLAGGESTARLAAQLHFSRQGVEYRITRLLRRFGVTNRAALASRAYTLGLLSADSWPPRVANTHIP